MQSSKRFSGIFFGNSPCIKLVTISKCIFHRVINRRSQIGMFITFPLINGISKRVNSSFFPYFAALFNRLFHRKEGSLLIAFIQTKGNRYWIVCLSISSTNEVHRLVSSVRVYRCKPANVQSV